MDEPDQFAGARGAGGGVCGLSAGGGVDGGLVVEAVKIATGLLEFPNPFMWLGMERISLRLRSGCQKTDRARLTSAIIMWQSKVPRPWGSVGRLTCERILVTTGAPKVMLGTK